MRTDITIRPLRTDDLPAVETLVRRSFSETSESTGDIEVRLLHEILESAYCMPELSFVAVLGDRMVGVVMFSRFPLTARPQDHAPASTGATPPLVIMTPVAVHPELLGEGIGTTMVTLGLEAVRQQQDISGILVEGSPAYYHRFGFGTSGTYGILPGESCVYPRTHPECLMAMEAAPGSLAGIRGYVNYHMYPCLLEPDAHPADPD